MLYHCKARVDSLWEHFFYVRSLLLGLVFYSQNAHARRKPTVFLGQEGPAEPAVVGVRVRVQPEEKGEKKSGRTPAQVVHKARKVTIVLPFFFSALSNFPSEG